MLPILIRLLALLVTSYAPEHLVGQNGNKGNDEKELIKVDRQWIEAEVKNDPVTLNNILTDKFLGWAAGLRRNKAQFISDHATGQLSYHSITPRGGHQLNFTGHTATLIYEATIQGRERGKEINGRYRVIHVFTNEQGKWQALASYEILTKPEPITVRRTPRNSDISQTSPNPNPFTSLRHEVALGHASTLRLRPTKLAYKASGFAQVARVGQTLLVRIRVRNLPFPSSLSTSTYRVWAYIPNYQRRVYIGDLPISAESRHAQRGGSDSAFRFAGLPAGSAFGGLMLTAEASSYVPGKSRRSQLVLLALTKEVSDRDIAAALGGETVSIPPPRRNKSSVRAFTRRISRRIVRGKRRRPTGRKIQKRVSRRQQ